MFKILSVKQDNSFVFNKPINSADSHSIIKKSALEFEVFLINTIKDCNKESQQKA